MTQRIVLLLVLLAVLGVSAPAWACANATSKMPKSPNRLAMEVAEYQLRRGANRDALKTVFSRLKRTNASPEVIKRRTGHTARRAMTAAALAVVRTRGRFAPTAEAPLVAPEDRLANVGWARDLLEALHDDSVVASKREHVATARATKPGSRPEALETLEALRDDGATLSSHSLRLMASLLAEQGHADKADAHRSLAAERAREELRKRFPRSYRSIQIRGHRKKIHRPKAPKPAAIALF